MKKTIMITGATDGIGLASAIKFASQGHHLLIHGRNPEKLKTVAAQLSALSTNGKVESYLADLSKLSEAIALAKQVKEGSSFEHIDVLINNAGVLKVSQAMTTDNLDVRFSVNTIAPYILTKALTSKLSGFGRVLNLSSAAQAPVDIDALLGKKQLNDMAAYSQSKLAITQWTLGIAKTNNALTYLAINPGSLLASKMVKEGFGIAGNDLNIGADILVRLSIEDGVHKYSGQYFDNDKGGFSSPHPDGMNIQKSKEIIKTIESILSAKT
ncbi:SDR family NAD(P)-dependent oxidoreductase [Colwellia sp. 1_MG-2023]|uniref:SDR family NAD(P)-dependent oxidoreductase n=1 Tax=Colwellia sp. 1_MG-2023 TaxID=3062649 RepID=UPI0026E446CF|nr:SDR family NAD(P)-dependent oxidoreductase [Colwellia sp. 1_MG-2023]MDO6445090.1 SDR family NAD(P)-dependent oxidoreductase [Colwellia sp. 1_MG-2023]